MSNDHQNADSITKGEKEPFSVLLMGEDSTSIRTPINILFTFNPKKENVKVISFPRDLYVDRYSETGEKIEKTKLLHVSAYNADPNYTIKSITNYLNVPIDYYARIPIEDIIPLIETNDQEVKKMIQQNNIATILQENGAYPELMNLVANHQTNLTNHASDKIKRKNYQYEVINLNNKLKKLMIDDIYYVELKSDFLDQTMNELQEHLAK